MVARVRITTLLLLASLLPPCALAAPSDDGARFTRFAGFSLASDTSLDEVKRRLGPAPLVEYGESSAYRASLCYSTGTILVGFLSEELGGPNHTLLGFSLAPVRPERQGQCASLSAGQLPGDPVIGGLRLGMSRKEATAVLARPDPGIRSSVRRFYESREPLTGPERADYLFAHPRAQAPEQWNVTVSVFATFAQDRLVELEIWKVRTP